MKKTIAEKKKSIHRNANTVSTEASGGCENNDAASGNPHLAKTDLKEIETRALNLLEDAYNAAAELSKARHDAKLSNTRVAGVARELKELIKVLSVYKSA